MEAIKLYFDTDENLDIQPIRPRPLVTPYSKPNIVEGKSFISHDWKKKRVLMEEGYIIQPNDCPPIRNLNSYGFEFFATANSKVIRNKYRSKRCTEEKCATNGWYSHLGDKHLKSDSGFFTSWLGNSDFFKIITGIIIYCPVGYGLFQGGTPYTGNSKITALSAIEYGNSNGVIRINGEKYFSVEMNLVCSLNSEEVKICRGQSLGIFYPVINPNKFCLGDYHDE